MNSGYKKATVDFDLRRNRGARVKSAGRLWRPAGAIAVDGARALLDATTFALSAAGFETKVYAYPVGEAPAVNATPDASAQLTFVSGNAEIPAGRELVIDIVTTSPPYAMNLTVPPFVRWNVTAMPGGRISIREMVLGGFNDADVGVLDNVGPNETRVEASGGVTGRIGVGRLAVRSRDAIQLSNGYPVGTVYVAARQWLQVRLQEGPESRVYLQTALDPMLSIVNMPHGGDVAVNGVRVPGMWDFTDYIVWTVILRERAMNANIEVFDAQGVIRATRGNITAGAPLVLSYAAIPIWLGTNTLGPTPLFLPNQPPRENMTTLPPVFSAPPVLGQGGAQQIPAGIARLRIVGLPPWTQVFLGDAAVSGRWETPEQAVYVIDSVPGLFNLRTIAPNGEVRQLALDLRAGVALPVTYANMPVTQPARQDPGAGGGGGNGAGPALMPERGVVVTGVPDGALVTLLWRPFSGEAVESLFASRAANGRATFPSLGRGNGILDAFSRPDLNAPLTAEGTALLREAAKADDRPGARRRATITLETDLLTVPYANLSMVRSPTLPEARPAPGSGQIVVEGLTNVVVGGNGVTLRSPGMALASNPDGSTAEVRQAVFDLAPGSYLVDAKGGTDAAPVLYRKRVELGAGQRIVESAATMPTVRADAQASDGAAMGRLVIRDLPGEKPSVYRGRFGSAAQSDDLAASWQPQDSAGTLGALALERGVTSYSGMLPEGDYVVRSGCTNGPEEANSREVTIRAGQTAEVGFAHLALCTSAGPDDTRTWPLMGPPSMRGASEKLDALMRGLPTDGFVAFSSSAAARAGEGLTGLFPGIGARAGAVVQDYSGSGLEGRLVREFQRVSGLTGRVQPTELIALYQPGRGMVIVPYSEAVNRVAALWDRVYPAGISSLGGR